MIFKILWKQVIHSYDGDEFNRFEEWSVITLSYEEVFSTFCRYDILSNSEAEFCTNQSMTCSDTESVG